MAGEKLLTATQVRNLKTPGRHADGGGLYLVIAPSGSRKWVLRKVVNGKRRDFGLGSASEVALAEARETATKYRQMIRQGVDPIEERRKTREAIPTFKEAAERVHRENLPTWKNEKHAAQWLRTLVNYAFLDIGATPIDQVDGPAVHGALMKVWLTRPETARRVRQRIGTVLDWASAKGFRAHPLDMRGLSRGLPKQPHNVQHHTALPYPELPGFIGELRKMENLSLSVRLALEFLILTAARSGEARGAR